MGDVGPSTVVTKDRRIVRVAIVDCTSGKNPPIKGKTTGIEAEGFLDLFLLTPWKDARIPAVPTRKFWYSKNRTACAFRYSLPKNCWHPWMKTIHLTSSTPQT